MFICWCIHDFSASKPSVITAANIYFIYVDPRFISLFRLSHKI